MSKTITHTLMAVVLPILWGLFCVVVNFVPFTIFPYYHQSFPVVLIVVFYVAIFYPYNLMVIPIFLLGLLSDALTTAPFGLHTFIFVGMYFITNLLRPYIQGLNFRFLWAIFCCVNLIMAIFWVWMARLMTGVWVTSSFWFVQYLFVCLLYPVFTYITAWIMHHIRGS